MRTRQPKLFSYVVDHDYGFAPNPYHGYCTLAHCKFSKNGRRRNMVELAELGDWIVGTGGADLSKSSGHGTIVYAMQVDLKLSLRDYFTDARFTKKKRSTKYRYGDNLKKHVSEPRFVLIAEHFYYFGSNAVAIPEQFKNGVHLLEKRGRGFKSNFPQSFIRKFEKWIETLPCGVQGEPCAINLSLRCGPCNRKSAA